MSQRRFDSELRHLRERLLGMAGRVEEAIGGAVRALLTRDEGLAQRVIDGDREIDRQEVEVDDDCLRLLACHQPEAGDLRFIAMVFKINNDLERMGDMATSIARQSLHLARESYLGDLDPFERLARLSLRMVKDSLDALVERNVDLALAVCGRDDEVDHLAAAVLRDQLASMTVLPASGARALGLILVVRALERIADHATNIAEDVVYLVQGKSIRHAGLK